MAQKTSVTFDDDTKAIMARRVAQTGLSVSAYLAQLVRRDDQELQLAADAAALHRAGLWGDERLTRVNSAAAGSRGE